MPEKASLSPQELAERVDHGLGRLARAKARDLDLLRHPRVRRVDMVVNVFGGNDDGQLRGV